MKSSIRDAEQSYSLKNIADRIEEEINKTDVSYSTIKESTDRLKESSHTHEQIGDALNESKSLLRNLYLRANFEDMLFYSSIIFYIVVILYIISTRTIISWFFSDENK
ncbi:t-SNARE coiled-coil-like proteiny domain-containing protein [Entamoeba marina]